MKKEGRGKRKWERKRKRRCKGRGNRRRRRRRKRRKQRCFWEQPPLPRRISWEGREGEEGWEGEEGEEEQEKGILGTGVPGCGAVPGTLHSELWLLFPTRSVTRPLLSQLQGTEFGILGIPAIPGIPTCLPPSPPPSPPPDVLPLSGEL